MQSRLEYLAGQVGITVQKVNPTAGSILFVRPAAKNHIMSYQYYVWLADTLSKMLPSGVKALIFDRSDWEVEPLKPVAGERAGEVRQAYEQGWYAAMQAIQARLK